MNAIGSNTLMTTLEPFKPAPESLWLIAIDNEITVAEVSKTEKSVWLTRSNQSWPLSEVKQWIAEIRCERRNDTTASWWEGAVYVDNYSKRHLSVEEAKNDSV